MKTEKEITQKVVSDLYFGDSIELDGSVIIKGLSAVRLTRSSRISGINVMICETNPKPQIPQEIDWDSLEVEVKEKLLSSIK